MNGIKELPIFIKPCPVPTFVMNDSSCSDMFNNLASSTLSVAD